MSMDREKLLLYAVTDRAWLKGRSLAECVEEALKGGVTMVQLREKELDTESFEQEAKELLALCHRYGVPLLINDDVQLAKKVGADGVHVGQKDMEAGEARRILGDDKIIGVTAKTAEAAKAAQEAGADYLGSGAMFGTETKADATNMSPERLKEICGSVSIPVTAIGGIRSDNIEKLEGCGMSGFAIVSGIFAAEDIQEEAQKLRKLAEKLVWKTK